MQKQTKSTPPSEKNTKAEILDAYNTLLNTIEGKEEPTQIQIQERTVIDQAAQETVEKIIGDLSQVRLSANQTISSLTEKLTQEAERFANLKKAITLAQKELTDIQKVKITATQLYLLIELHKRTEKEFTQEMDTKRSTWEEEQKTYELQLKQQRKREEDEYEYTKNIQRKRDTDQWTEEQRKHEQQKAEETKAKDEMLKELEELRKQVITFPATLEKEIKVKVAEAVSQVTREAQMQQTLAKQEANAKLQLAEQKITSLEANLTTLRIENKELKLQMEKATNNIKDIAVSVVEGNRKETAIQARIQPQEITK